MNNALTADDLSDIGLENLYYVAKNTFSDWRMLPRASELEGNGAELLKLGLIEERVPEKHGIPGSARVGVTDAGLDLLDAIKAA